MFKWIALALLLVVSPVPAQEHGKDTCITPEVMTNRAKANDSNSYIYYKLYSVDIGFEDPVDVIIYSNGDDYILVAFDKGCFAAYSVLTEEEVIKFLNQHSKKATNS